MITIRNATNEDADAWLKLRCDLWPECSPDTHRAEIASFLAASAREPQAVLLAVNDEGRIVGFVELSIRPYAEGCSSDRVAFLEGWYVEAGSRRRGIGKALVAAAERWGTAQACVEFASDTQADNEISRAAHLDCGFSEVGMVRCFRKELPSKAGQDTERRAPDLSDPERPVSLHIEEVPSAEAPMELLLLADPSEEKLRSYLPQSRCFLASSHGLVVGACVVQALGQGAHELMSIAVHPDHQQSGYGTALLKWVIDYCRKSGARQLEVGTGSFGYQLTFYQRQGFRVTAIDRDFFTTNYSEPIFEDGVQLFDMLRLTLRYAR